MAFGWKDAAQFALTLPGVSMGPGAKGSVSPQVRGRQIVSQGRQPETYVLRATREEIEVLLETDPACFWQTPQYEGWPCILVRGAAADPERMRILIARAWWDRASGKQRAARGGERP